MKSLLWKYRYARHMFDRIEGDGLKDWKFCWYNACVSWEELDGPNSDPIDSANEEMSCWSE